MTVVLVAPGSGLNGAAPVRKGSAQPCQGHVLVRVFDGMDNRTGDAPGVGRSVMMFGGKGGVGKTTCAAATALYHSRLGRKTLVISTDATPSLSHIFEVDGRDRVGRVARHLFFTELGQETVREMWDRKFGREVHEVFSSFVSIGYEEFAVFMTSVLPGLSDEFMVDHTRELWALGEYDVIVWDTAPMGQTLALLKTPELLVRHLRMAPRIYSSLRVGEKSRESVLSILKRWEKLSATDMEFLRVQVSVTLVTIAEALAVEQLEGILRELRDAGVTVQQVIVNNLVRDQDSEFLRTRAAHQRHYLDAIYGKCRGVKIIELPLFATEVKGLDRLEQVASVLFPRESTTGAPDHRCFPEEVEPRPVDTT